MITWFNPRAAELWGREPELNSARDRYCGSFKLFDVDGAPIPHEECWMAKALREDREFDGHEIVIERPDGSRWTALAHASPLHDEAGKLIGAVNVLVDITQRKQMEEFLREADRRKSDFLATLAHELRNPLAPLRNGLHILRMADQDAAAVEEARLMMERQLGHMVRLIDDLLDLSRITNGKLELRKERIDLQAVVKDAVESARPQIEQAGQELRVLLPRKPIEVEADRTRLAQVFGNLLDNGAKYTERGGHIRLTLEQQGSDAVVTVADDGVGIPADVLPLIFDMFTQANGTLERSRGGLGIGLSLVRRFVEMHGGSVEACSAGPGKGSEFVVRLPVAPPRARETHAQPGAYEPAPRASQYRILVVDDNRDAAISASLLLKISGHETRTAHDGLEALEVAAAFRPDVVLLDLGLPKLNGYDVCSRIRAEPWGKTMLLIALSGWGQDQDKRRSKEAGFNFHLVKPVDPASLQKLLAGLLVV